MSLDVYLKRKRLIIYPDDDLECVEEYEILYSDNIRHNLCKMAVKAGIYEALWRPHRLHNNYLESYSANYNAEYEFENSVEILAKDIIALLQKGYDRLISEKDYFEKFNSPNGWGL